MMDVWDRLLRTGPEMVQPRMGPIDLISLLQGVNAHGHDEASLSTRFYADRAAGGHRDHRGLDRLALAGCPVGARGGPPRPVHQQPQAARVGRAQLSLDL